MTSEPLVEAVGRRLTSLHLTLAVAESCTGGLLGDLLTNVPGSSAYFVGGVMAYAYEAKTALLGITPEFLLEHTSVSEPVARAMARSIRQRLNADLGVAITGIAGPGGGSADKPVGLTFLALSGKHADWSRRYVWAGDRLANKASSAQAALRLILEYLDTFHGGESG